MLIAIGVGSVVKGLDGRAQVHDALAQEQITGMPQFTPSGIAAKVRAAGLQGVTLPTCSVAGEKIDDGSSAKCFAEYMRVDALMATKGATYAQMPRFASEDGKGTNVEAQAVRMENGAPMNNPARQVWVTETALATALNTSYMAEQTALFGSVVGGALLLVGFALAGLLGPGEVPRPGPALEAIAEAVAGGDLQRRFVRRRDVARPSALRADPATGTQGGGEPREQRVVIVDPVEDGAREDRVDLLAVVQAQPREIGEAHVGRRAGELLAGAGDHLPRAVDRDRAAARQALEDEPGDPARAAAGVEHGLVAAQLEAVEDRLRPGHVGVRHPVVGVGVPRPTLAAHSAVVTGPCRSRSLS